MALIKPTLENHPAGPRTAEEAAEDDRRILDLTPDIKAFLEHLRASKKKLRGKSLEEVARFAVKYAANRHLSLDKHEEESRCENCKRREDKCRCPTEIKARIVVARGRAQDTPLERVTMFDQKFGHLKEGK